MKYFLVLLFLASAVLAEDEIIKEEEVQAAQFMPMDMGNYWDPMMNMNPIYGMNPMMKNPMMGMNQWDMMNPMGMMYSLDTSNEEKTDVDSAGFMMMPSMGCSSTCMCHQRCSMVWWMPCNCAPCNGCGCCNKNNGGNGNGNQPGPDPEETTTTVTVTTTTEATTTTASCDRGCCSGCSCGRPCTVWWMCPRPCPPSCCNGGCCNSAPPPPPPPSCCSCPTCVPWFPCQPCKCINNCCPGSSCCSGSGCDKPTTNAPKKPEAPTEATTKRFPELDVYPPKVDDKWGNEWDNKEWGNEWNNKEWGNEWDNKEWNKEWDVKWDEHPILDKWDDKLDNKKDTNIPEKWDSREPWVDFPVRNPREPIQIPPVRDILSDIDRRDRREPIPPVRDILRDIDRRDRREPIQYPPPRDNILNDWELQENLRDPRNEFIRNGRN